MAIFLSFMQGYVNYLSFFSTILQFIYLYNHKTIFKYRAMRKNLLIGIIGGAAVGAAASYLMNSQNRTGFVNGIKDLSETVTDTYNGLLGNEAASGSTGRSQTRGRSTGSTSGRSSSGSSTTKRG
jgi:hypothetical protein